VVEMFDHVGFFAFRQLATTVVTGSIKGMAA
jgi:hypothetical protein